MRKNLLITMSGGTTSVINATLVGIIKAIQDSNTGGRVIAGVPGIKGVLQESLFDLTDLSESNLKALYFTPASGFIGTTRIKPMDKDKLEKIADKSVEALKKGKKISTRLHLIPPSWKLLLSMV